MHSHLIYPFVYYSISINHFMISSTLNLCLIIIRMSLMRLYLIPLTFSAIWQNFLIKTQSQIIEFLTKKRARNCNFHKISLSRNLANLNRENILPFKKVINKYTLLLCVVIDSGLSYSIFVADTADKICRAKQFWWRNLASHD